VTSAQPQQTTMGWRGFLDRILSLKRPHHSYSGGVSDTRVSARAERPQARACFLLLICVFSSQTHEGLLGKSTKASVVPDLNSAVLSVDF
jgi:hypothetical protein